MNSESFRLYLLYMKHKSYKFKLSPNVVQLEYLNKTIGSCRFIYNYFLGERIEYYKKNKTLKGFKQTTEKELKNQFEWLKEVDSTSLQQKRLDLDSAYKNFFNKLKEGKVTSIKFKSKKESKQTARMVSQSFHIDLENHKLKLPKIGWIKYRDNRSFDEKNIKSITIIKDNLDNYYASILVEESIDALQPSTNWVGIDLGIKTYATCSNGEKIDNPKTFEKYEKKLATVQKKFSKKVKGSKNWYKQKKRVNKIYQKITNIRKDFLHKLSTKLINENQVICLEDLNVQGMVKNHKLSKAIQSCSWSTFVNFLEYKAEWYGRTIVRIDPWYPSSKLCSCCGHKLEKLDLDQRSWVCSSCHSENDRDLNASINILQEGIRLLGSVGTTRT